MSKEKEKTGSKFFLRLTVLVLLIVAIVQGYVILKSKRFIDKYSNEKGLVEFVESEFKRDKDNVKNMFDSFLSDTSYKGTPLKEIKEKKEKDLDIQTKPIKKKFDDWYKEKFGDSSIKHTVKLKGSKIIITVNIPGVKKESVDITIQDDVIKMSGNLKGEGARYFNHSILLPMQADPKSSKVEFDAGANKIKIIFDLKT